MNDTPLWGLCTHCGKAPATEIHHAGVVKLCPTCTELRKGEDWGLPPGLAQEGENCERFQGTDHTPVNGLDPDSLLRREQDPAIENKSSDVPSATDAERQLWAAAYVDCNLGFRVRVGDGADPDGESDLLVDLVGEDHRDLRQLVERGWIPTLRQAKRMIAWRYENERWKQEWLAKNRGALSSLKAVQQFERCLASMNADHSQPGSETSEPTALGDAAGSHLTEDKYKRALEELRVEVKEISESLPFSYTHRKLLALIDKKLNEVKE